MSGSARLGRRFLLLGAAGTLAGCGFHPVYGPSGKNGVQVQTDLGLVNVMPSYERIGQILRLATQERLEGTGAPVEKAYDLQLLLAFSGSTMGILPDSSVTRIRYSGSVNYILTQQTGDKKSLTRGTVSLSDAMNEIDNQPFAADLETDAIEKRLMENLAELVVERLAIYFRKHPGGK